MDPRAYTPALADKHLWSTFIFGLVLVFNHRAHLELTPTELIILAAVLGVYIGQSQVTAIARLRTLMAPAPADSKPQGDA